jgi:hypothetical protein
MIYIVKNIDTGVESYVTKQRFQYLKTKDGYECEVLGADAVQPTMKPKSTDYTVREVQGMASEMSKAELQEFIPEDEDRATVLKLID